MIKIVANMPLLNGVYELGIEGPLIASITPSTQETDLCVGPTLFDIQVNGYGGANCRLRTAADKGELAYINRIMREHGVGWWIPTVITNNDETLSTAFKLIGEALDADPDTAASIPGLHLEGPYISPVEGSRGVHPLDCIRPPCWDEFQKYQELSGHRIRYITLAPESKGAPEFIRRCVASGVIVSMGHTNMDREDLRRAVEAGATLSTHLGNGAQNMIQRHNNYIWYQLACRDTFAAMISDGEHLPQEALYCMLRAKGLDHSLITSDCVGLGGLPAGIYGSIEKTATGRLVATGTTNLSGSSSNLRECTETVIRLGKVTHAEAWRLASIQPARAMGLDQRLGLEPGKEASLTVYRYHEAGPRIEVLQTWVAGKKVFDAANSVRTVVRAEFNDTI